MDAILRPVRIAGAPIVGTIVAPSTVAAIARRVFVLLLALSTLCAAGPALAATGRVTDPDAPRALPDAGPVAVRWSDPAQFSELRGSGNRSEAARGDWVVALAQHVRKRTEPRLAAGERLDIEILDIRRAGDFEPWRGPEFHSVRFMRDIHWPRIALRIRRIGADGNVVAESERTLSDSAYLSRSSTVAASDSLRYEKAMIDRWVGREFGAARR
jgi:Protein of unknown function (DUF3016)